MSDIVVGHSCKFVSSSYNAKWNPAHICKIMIEKETERLLGEMNHILIITFKGSKY